MASSWNDTLHAAIASATAERPWLVPVAVWATVSAIAIALTDMRGLLVAGLAGVAGAAFARPAVSAPPPTNSVALQPPGATVAGSSVDTPATSRAAAHQPWHRMIEILPEPVVALDEELRVLHASDAARQMYPTLRTTGPIALVSRSPELAEALRHALRYGEKRTVRLHERIPVERRVDAAIAPLTSPEPGHPAVLIVLRDVSERDRLEQMRADFIAHASHELRTPLAALRGFIETLQGAARDDAVARDRFLGIMSTEAHRMARLLDDLLSLSRVEMRAHIAPTTTVELKEIVADVVETLAPLAEKAGTTVEITAPDNDVVVPGDSDELTQVFVNLVQNAIKYGRKDGRVEIALDWVGVGDRKRVHVAIRDDGMGIAEEHLPRLTERFYRVDDKTSREKGGTGLGLALSKHILNRHRGVLRISSRVGVGSTFTVDLPAPAK